MFSLSKIFRVCLFSDSLKRAYFREFNCNRTFKLRETPLNFKFSNEITSMVKDFKEMCESQFTGKSKCEEIKQ